MRIRFKGVVKCVAEVASLRSYPRKRWMGRFDEGLISCRRIAERMIDAGGYLATFQRRNKPLQRGVVK